MFFGGLIMNKFLITLATLVAFTLSGLAYAQDEELSAEEIAAAEAEAAAAEALAAHATYHEDIPVYETGSSAMNVKLGGRMQRIIGLGDDVDGGIAEQFTNFNISANTTADNGWVVGGSMTIVTAGTTGATYAPSTNSMYVQTDLMTINIGNTVGPAISSVPGVNAMVPGGGVDAGYQFLFDGGNLASQGVQFREAYYAHNAAKIDIDLPSVNGFTVGASYTPSNEYNGATQARAANDNEDGNHGEVIEVAMKYDGELDGGLTYTIGAAALSGNAQSTITGQAARVTVNNDLNSFAAGIQITRGNLSVGVNGFDNGASFGASSDDVKARHSGYNTGITWAMGNITLGVGYSHQELVRGTRALASLAGTGAAGDVAEDNITMIGLGYDMGGGISTYIQLSNNDHTDGNPLTAEVDPQVLFAGINIGF